MTMPQTSSLYLDPHQARDREPTEYENLLADAVESAYAVGIHDLAGLVAHLNDGGVPAPGGKPWTPDLFEAEMKRLGA
jgi:hypothetical protein